MFMYHVCRKYVVLTVTLKHPRTLYSIILPLCTDSNWHVTTDNQDSAAQDSDKVAASQLGYVCHSALVTYNVTSLGI